jgi:hypothetical protein
MRSRAPGQQGKNNVNGPSSKNLARSRLSLRFGFAPVRDGSKAASIRFGGEPASPRRGTPCRTRAGADAAPRRFARTLRRHRRPADGLAGLRSGRGLGRRPLPRRGRGVHLDGNLHDPHVLGRRR